MWPEDPIDPSRPIAVDPTRVWRTYLGGRLLDEIYGVEEPRDSEYPESWICSTVEAQNGFSGQDESEGLSRIKQHSAGVSPTLRDVLGSNSSAFLGERHVASFGADLGVLVKLIDSSERLPIQVHPNRADARRNFDSRYGKSESWIVLGVRDSVGEEPSVLVGFKRGVTEERWRRLFDEQDIQGMIDSLHRVPVQVGDVIIIPGGMPHAIGQGCLLLEAQEPTDITLRPERTTATGRVLPDVACHRGVGYDAMFSVFDYSTYTISELREARMKRISFDGTDPGAKVVIGPDDGMPFVVRHYSVSTSAELVRDQLSSIVMSVSGCGTVGDVPIGPYDAFFLPASLENRSIESNGNSSLELIECSAAEVPD